ncbi:MAG: hypothetical protein JWP81_1071 [Ferruginibacter sp.]|nr:hypothetical protein [Ferruginibacter sp.]
MTEVDEIAKARAKKSGMPADVHIPIGARDQDAITKLYWQNYIYRRR